MGRTIKLGFSSYEAEIINNYSIDPPKYTYAMTAIFARGGTDVDYDNMTLNEIGFGFVDFEVTFIYI